MTVVAYVLMAFYIGMFIAKPKFAKDGIGKTLLRADVCGSGVLVVVEAVALCGVVGPLAVDVAIYSQ